MMNLSPEAIRAGLLYLSYCLFVSALIIKLNKE